MLLTRSSQCSRSASLLRSSYGLIYLLPFPLPRLVDAHYQFCKRHNLLDKNGTPLPDDVIERSLAEYDVCDTNGQQ